MADLYDILLNRSKQQMTDDNRLSWGRAYPPKLTKEGLKRGKVEVIGKLPSGANQTIPQILNHEKFHQAQFLADLVEKKMEDPDFLGTAMGGNETGATADDWLRFRLKNPLSGLAINNTKLAELPAYAFTSEISHDRVPAQRAFNDYMDMVRRRNPTTANILSQAMAPSLVRENLKSHPQPISMSKPPSVEYVPRDKWGSQIESLMNLLYYGRPHITKREPY